MFRYKELEDLLMELLIPRELREQEGLPLFPDEM